MGGDLAMKSVKVDGRSSSHSRSQIDEFRMHNRVRQGTGNLDRPGQGRPGQARAGQDRTGLDRRGPERRGSSMVEYWHFNIVERMPLLN
jgi:hypothetical protein